MNRAFPHRRQHRTLVRRLALTFLACLPGMIIAVLAGEARAWRQGPPADRVGACGFGLTCGDTGCHSGPPQQGTLTWEFGEEVSPGTVQLPSAYVPGRTYQMRLQLRDEDDGVYPPDEDAEVWGFELAATIHCPLVEQGGMIELLDTGRTRLRSGSGGIAHISHSCLSPTDDPAECGIRPLGDPNENGWSFLWTAPARESGEVRFYLAINSANYNAQSDGDRITLGRADLPEEACNPPLVRDLRVERTDCDPGQPGTPMTNLVWAPADPGDIVRTAFTLGDLQQNRSTWTDAGSDCLPLQDGQALVFYSVARTCDLGGEGH